MAEIGLDDPEIGRRVEALGGQGLGRAEIAIALGLNLVSLNAREAADPALAEALRWASEARVAWWHGQMRQRLVENFDWDLWLTEFRYHFPDQPLPWEPDPPAEPPEPAAYQPRWRRGGFY